MSAADGILARVAAIPYNFDSDDAMYLFRHHQDILEYVVVGYVLLISFGPQLLEQLQYGGEPSTSKDLTEEAKRERRAPQEARFQARVKNAMRVWNVVLSVFSTLGFISSFHLLGYLLSTRSFYQVSCEFDYFSAYDGPCAFWVFSFMISKIPEMMDTVFLVLQKKRIIFLHSYHHLTVTIFCWFAGRELYPAGMIFTAMNYGVHSFMYAYYFLSSFACLRRATRVVAPLLTALQILQMVVGFGVCLYVGFYSFIYDYGVDGVVNLRGRVVYRCEPQKGVTRLGLLMYGSYFFLFVAFFVNKYLSGSKARRDACPSSQKDATVTAGKKNG